MILDLEAPDCPTDFTCDVAIVGAGAVGISMAANLARRGVDVLLLEGGGRGLEASSQAIYDAYSVGHPLDGLKNGRFRLFGGTTNFWGGQLVRFDPIVFEPRAWLSACGWPLTRQTLDPYYDQFSKMVGLPDGLEDGALWRRLKIETPAWGTDLELFLTRWLRNPNFAQAFRADLDGAALRTVVHANVVGLEPDQAAQAVTALKVRTLGGREARVRASKVVLTCGTIEISRLLMLPFADARPTPWGDHRWLGRGFMDHVDCTAGRVRVLDRSRFHKIFDNIYVDGFKYNPKLKLSSSAQKANDALGIACHIIFSSGYSEHLSNLKIFIKAIINGRVPKDIAKVPGYIASLWKVAIPLAIRYLRSNRAFNPSDAGVFLQLTCEQWPNPESRISLREEKDGLGLPKVEVDWSLDGREVETMALFSERVAETLSQLGLAEIDLDPQLAARDPAFLKATDDGFHQMGGARMSERAEDGIVDTNLKLHLCENLYVAGAAVYPGSGFANPTYTAIALGLRLCDHLAGTAH